MFKSNQNQLTSQEIKQWYVYQEELVEQKLKDLNSDAIQQIRSKIHRRQTMQEKDQNKQLLERERTKIYEQMIAHVQQCEHPRCKTVDEICLQYNLSNLAEIKQDNVHLIHKFGQSSGYTRTDCPVGGELNKRMLETHRLLKSGLF